MSFREPHSCGSSSGHVTYTAGKTRPLQVLAKFTPLYGVNQLVHWPLTGGAMDVWWVVNAVAWLAIFTVGAVWRFRKDTARV